jgi:hypothetical protein
MSRSLKVILAILAIAALSWLILTLIKWARRPSLPHQVLRDELPRIVSEWQMNSEDESFVVFFFNLPETQDEDPPNLQYSVEDGRLGLDWVLVSAQNVRDEEAISRFIKNNGYGVTKKEMNGVEYLRVEGSGLEQLGLKILRDFYHLGSDTRLQLTDG